jgi:hypothetical protein
MSYNQKIRTANVENLFLITKEKYLFFLIYVNYNIYFISQLYLCTKFRIEKTLNHIVIYRDFVFC